MTAQELRLGNWIEFPKNGYKGNTNSQVFDISEEKLNYCANPKDCFPIPITPKILEACGFENMNFKFVIADFKMMQHSGGFDIYWIGMFLRTAEYLHELQNLIFSLGCFELTYNPQ